MLGSNVIVIATILFLLLSAVALIFMVYTIGKGANEEAERNRLEAERKCLETERSRLEAERKRLETERSRLEAERKRLETERNRLEAERKRWKKEREGWEKEWKRLPEVQTLLHDNSSNFVPEKYDVLSDSPYEEKEDSLYKENNLKHLNSRYKGAVDEEMLLLLNVLAPQAKGNR